MKGYQEEQAKNSSESGERGTQVSKAIQKTSSWTLRKFRTIPPTIRILAFASHSSLVLDISIVWTSTRLFMLEHEQS